jgi:hypothetical protein
VSAQRKGHELVVQLGRRRAAAAPAGSGLPVFTRPACLACGWVGRRYALDDAGDRAMQAELLDHGSRKPRPAEDPGTLAPGLAAT